MFSYIILCVLDNVHPRVKFTKEAYNKTKNRKSDGGYKCSDKSRLAGLRCNCNKYFLELKFLPAAGSYRTFLLFLLLFIFCVCLFFKVEYFGTYQTIK